MHKLRKDTISPIAVGGVGRRAFVGSVALGTAISLGARPAPAAAPSAAIPSLAAEGSSSGRDTSEEIAEFVTSLTFEDLSERTISIAKDRILDTLSCIIGAIMKKDVSAVRGSLFTAAGAPCTIAGAKTRGWPAEAAMLMTSMARNLDYMDTYTGPHGGGHPSNCLGPILACAEYAGAQTKDVITAMVAGTEVLGAFADVINSRQRTGVEHVAYVGLAMTAGAGKALGLNTGQMKNALSIAAASYTPLQVTRAEQLTMWKGYASGFGAQNAVTAAILAKNGMEGPANAFDGARGWKEVVAGEDFELTFTKGQRIHNVWTKLYLAETYALSAVEGAIEVATQYDIDPDGIESVTLKSFSNAVGRLGAAKGRDVYNITTKPEADHSFPYMIAAALIDRALTEEQYTDERIHSPDVQALLRKVRVVEDERFNRIFVDGLSPAPAEIEVVMTGGARHKIIKEYFSGHPKQPATKQQLHDKLRLLGGSWLDEGATGVLIDIVETLERRTLKDLMLFLV